MTDIAIKVEGLSKLYRIGQREPYRTLRDTLTNAFVAPFRGFRNLRSSMLHPSSSDNLPSSISNPSSNTIWALKDVSFEVKQGEVIGIIGRNGAGKSTLLKILSRITEPTEGYADIYGRVGSLLEVGTGFHPELTGRENVFLNAAILGMKKQKIGRQFDAIVDFAEVEKFIDTPVKHYSSGMYLRLAFAVAAHLEPEILLVDEVLAVGDLVFQKKCLSKMGDVADEGRTVIFVSHQMNQIRRLCRSVIWLDAGRIREVGDAKEVVSFYEGAANVFNQKAVKRDGNHTPAHFLRWEILEPHHERPNVLDSVGPMTLSFVLEVKKPINNGQHGIALYSSDGQLMWGTDVNRITLKGGIYEFTYRLAGLPLRPGSYCWRVSIYDDKNLLDDWTCVPELVVATEPVTHSKDEWAGILNIPCEFTIEEK